MWLYGLLCLVYSVTNVTKRASGEAKKTLSPLALLSFAFRCFGLLAHCTRLLTALDASRCTALALLPASLERKRILSNFPRNSRKVGNSKEFCKKISPLPSSTCFLDWEGKKFNFWTFSHAWTWTIPLFAMGHMEELIIRMGKPRAGCSALVIDGPLTYLR